MAKNESDYAALVNSGALELPEPFRSSRQGWQEVDTRRGVAGLALLTMVGIFTINILNPPPNPVPRSLPDTNSDTVHQIAGLRIADENLRWEMGLRDIPPPRLVTDEPFDFQTNGPLDVLERANFQSRVLGRIEEGPHRGLYLIVDQDAQWCGIKINKQDTLPLGVVACNSHYSSTGSLFVGPNGLGDFPPESVKYPYLTS